ESASWRRLFLLYRGDLEACLELPQPFRSPGPFCWAPQDPDIVRRIITVHIITAAIPTTAFQIHTMPTMDVPDSTREPMVRLRDSPTPIGCSAVIAGPSILGRHESNAAETRRCHASPRLTE